MKHRSELATLLFGMPGFVAGATEVIDGDLWMYVETVDPGPVGCPSCGTWAVGNGRSTVKVRDLPALGRPVVVVWAKRRWHCPDRDCDTSAWVERSDAIAPRASLTERARAYICEQVGRWRRSVSSLAAEFGVGWHTAMAAVVDHGAPLVDDPARIGPVRALGIDEHNFSRARFDRPASFSTVLVDLDRGRLIDLLAGQEQERLRGWLEGRPSAWTDGVEVVGMDQYQAYRSAVSRPRKGDDTPPPLAHADVVVDPFHVVAMANDRITVVRLRVQQATRGRRGRTGDPLYGIRRLLLRGAERLGPHARARLDAGLAAGDPDGHIRATYQIKERIRAVYAVNSPQWATALIDQVIADCAASPVPECRTMVRALRSWKHAIIAHHRHRTSNATTEAVNLSLEEMVRRARGFRNFNNYRLRMLLALGTQWHTQPTAQIRGRQPRLVA